MVGLIVLSLDQHGAFADVVQRQCATLIECRAPRLRLAPLWSQAFQPLARNIFWLSDAAAVKARYL